MQFHEFVCEKLKNAGSVQAKKMFGTYNICLDNVKLGVLCVNKWYLRKTHAGDAFLEAKGINLPTGIKETSYIVTNFDDEETLSTLAKITRDELLKS